MNKTEFKITEEIGDFFNPSENLFAIDDENNVYKIFESERTFTVGNCLGKILAVVDSDNKFLCFIYPLFSSGSDSNGKVYRRQFKEDINRYKEIIKNYE